jgi:hypothetical protein
MRKRFKQAEPREFHDDDLDVPPCFASSVLDQTPFGEDIGHQTWIEFPFIDGSSRSSSDSDVHSPETLSTESEDDHAVSTMSLKLSKVISAAPALNEMWIGGYSHTQEEPLARIPHAMSACAIEGPFHDKPDIAKSLLAGAHGIDIDSLGAIEPQERAIEPAMTPSDKSAPPVQRAAHNAMERNRRVNLRKCFDDLRAVLPRLRDGKAPALQVLREAEQFIHALHKEEQDLLATKTQLIQQNNTIRSQVSQLQGVLAGQQLALPLAAQDQPSV